MKKITSTLLLIAMLVSIGASTVACNKEEAQETNTTTDTTEGSSDTGVETNESDTETTRAMHSLPDTLDFGGEEFLTIAWEWYSSYIFAEETTGDAMNDAVYSRRIKTEEFLNINMAYDLEPAYADVIAMTKNAVTAGDDVYDLCQIHGIANVAEMVTTGMLYNFDDLPYIDMTADWWNRERMDSLRLGKNTYYGVSDYMIPCPYVIFFNKDMVTNYGLDNPYELVYDGKWTLDKFTDMAVAVTQDVNGDGQYTMDDIAGVTTNETSKYISFMTAAGLFLTSSESGKLKLAMNGERAVSIVEKMYKLVSNPGTVFVPAGSSESDMIPMDSGRLLFRLASIASANIFRDCEVDVGILPYPKFDEEQEDYITLEWGGLMCVPSTIQKADMVGATLEYLAWESANEVIPAYYDKTLSGKIARDEDSVRMLDILFDTMVYEVGGNYFGFTAGFSKLFYTIGYLVVEQKSTDFASWYATYEKSAQSTIDDFYTALEKMEG